MIRIEHQLDDPTLTHAIGLTIGRMLRTGDVLCLHGELGAGKTTLVRAIAEGMRLLPAAVSSPTYVIINRYTEPASTASPLPDSPAPPDSPETRSADDSTLPKALLHMDAYRLEHDQTQLEDLGFDRAFEDAAACIEWPSLVEERLREFLGSSWDERVGQVTLEHVDERTRHATIELPDTWASRDAADRLATNSPRFCPRTGDPVAPDAPSYPFASERAQQSDLFGWFAEAYRVTRPIEEDDLGAAEGGGGGVGGGVGGAY